MRKEIIFKKLKNGDYSVWFRGRKVGHIRKMRDYWRAEDAGGEWIISEDKLLSTAKARYKLTV